MALEELNTAIWLGGSAGGNAISIMYDFLTVISTVSISFVAGIFAFASDSGAGTWQLGLVLGVAACCVIIEFCFPCNDRLATLSNLLCSICDVIAMGLTIWATMVASLASKLTEAGATIVLVSPYIPLVLSFYDALLYPLVLIVWRTYGSPLEVRTHAVGVQTTAPLIPLFDLFIRKYLHNDFHAPALIACGIM